MAGRDSFRLACGGILAVSGDSIWIDLHYLHEGTMKFGYFDDEQREYVITRPDTPLPWINYLGCEAYFGIISNTAGGYSFYKDARLRRLTRYRYNNAPLDIGGRYIYLRDDDTSLPQYLVAYLAAHPHATWMSTSAAMEWATRPSNPPAQGSRHTSVISSRWAKTWKSGS